jgi:endoglucanase
MKMTMTLTSIVLLALMTGCSQFEHTSNNSETKDSICSPVNPSGFKIHRGVNVSHWLSQVAGWAVRDKFFTREDVKLIKSFGFDHIRLPVDEEELWEEDGTVKQDALKYLTDCIDWCLAEDLRVIVDLHILRSHHFNARNNEGRMTLWEDAAAQENFYQLWRNLSAYLNHYPNDMVAYEPMNEPAAPEHDQWNRLIRKAIKEIRALEPERVIIMGSNRWQQPFTFPFLDVPDGDPNIILSVHTYHPYFITHYRAPWSVARFYTGPVNYPGVCITQEDFDKYIDTENEGLMARLEEENATGEYNKEYMMEIVRPAAEKAKEYNLQLYCSEFGCLPNVDREMRLRYYKDITDVFRAYGMAYAVWDYKGNFSIVGWDQKNLVTLEPDSTLIDIIIK